MPTGAVPGPVMVAMPDETEIVPRGAPSMAKVTVPVAAGPVVVGWMAAVMV